MLNKFTVWDEIGWDFRRPGDIYISKRRFVATQMAMPMELWNESSGTAMSGYTASDTRLIRDQQVAVIAGEGQGWMARVVGVVARLPECLYRVELADGRHMAKLESELEPLGGDRR